MITPDLPKNKYNKWCEKKGLCGDHESHKRARIASRLKGLTYYERAIFFLNELTGCEGIEFVAFSNIELNNYVMLANNIILVPCFISEENDIQDQIFQAKDKLRNYGKFIYDGWIPVDIWDDEHVRNAIRDVDEALSIFCLPVNGAFFEWEPKYYHVVPIESITGYCFTEKELTESEELSKRINSLDERDKAAIYKSISWLDQSSRLNDSIARFLFLILAIESLATYIEGKKAPKTFINLRAEPIEHESQEKCIEEILSNELQVDKIKAIERSYFECRGIKRRIEAHLRKVFNSDPKPSDTLFKDKIEGKTLYDLRNDIAHGSVDTLSGVQRDKIHQRLPEVENIAHRYIYAVIKKTLGFKPTPGTIYASTTISAGDMIAGNGVTHQGPVHMAIQYSEGIPRKRCI